MSDEKFVVNNFKGVQVSCSETQWTEHVVSAHPIMKNNIEAVKDTIIDPDSVYKTNKPVNREVYFKLSDLATYSTNFYTKVVVEYKNDRGELVTAFPSRSETGGIGDVVYKRESKD